MPEVEKELIEYRIQRRSWVDERQVDARIQCRADSQRVNWNKYNGLLGQTVIEVERNS